MIVGIFGKDLYVRKNAIKYRKTLGEVSLYLEGDSSTEMKLRQTAESESLFDEQYMLYGESLLSSIPENVRDEVLALCKQSKHVFIFDEIDETASHKKILEKVSDHFFDASSEKQKKEFPKALCEAIKERNNKRAWTEFLRVKDGEAELLHGALLWQIKVLWSDVLSGKKALYTKKELEEKSKDLIVMFHRAHRGERGLRSEMERWVLSL